MLDVDLHELLKGGISRYELVAAVAKRARQIVDENVERNEIMTEKPVSIAVSDYLAGKWSIDPNEAIPGRFKDGEL